MTDTLIVVRDIHFASSLLVAGIVFFDLFVATPVLRTASHAESSFRNMAGRILWISLALSVVTGMAWLGLLSSRIAAKPLSDVIADGTIWIMLTQTQVGFAWEIRAVLSGLLAMGLLLRHKTAEGRAAQCLAILVSVLAGTYLGTLAFAGHGAEGLGGERYVHLAADFMHLNAAGLWLGALVPFTLLVMHLLRFRDDGSVPAIAAAGNRFSTLGIVAVAIVLVSGTINASFLVNGAHSLIDTTYGRLLLLKITLFAAMLCLAGVNRQHLLPKLHDGVAPDQSLRIIRRLLRHSLAEIGLGLAIILIVGMLGVMAPANEMTAHTH
ncbi:MAG TPA: copper homeostasis membrane protein CopD [Bradyrhizobium sp.]|nr:copper homeostasis membrane protein CopD [Bradyrhizobium sp.]